MLLQRKRTYRRVRILLALLVRHLLERLVADVPVDLPGREDVALGEDVLDLLECTPSGLGEAEQDVDERSEVEGTENEVGLVGNGGQAGRDGPSKGEVEEPVGSGGDGDGLSTDAHGEDLSRVRPRDRAHGDGEGADEEVGHDDDGVPHGVVALDDPCPLAVWEMPLAECYRAAN